jgi:GR25 family glycosyltransferase involved in LPS biosynthesis
MTTPDDIYISCINLDRSVDRWRRYEKLNTELKKKIVRFPAVDGRKIDYLSSPDISIRTKINILNEHKRSQSDIETVGAVGCYLSHIGALQDFYLTRKEKYLLLLEDDAEISSKTITELPQYVDSLPEGVKDKWDLLLIGDVHLYPFNYETLPWTPERKIYSAETHKYPIRFQSSEYRYQDVKHFIGTHAILYRRECIPTILNHHLPVEMAWDIFLSVLSEFGYIKILKDAEYPHVHQNILSSDIGHVVSISLLNQNDLWFKPAVWILIFVLVVIGLKKKFS